MNDELELFDQKLNKQLKKYSSFQKIVKKSDKYKSFLSEIVSNFWIPYYLLIKLINNENDRWNPNRKSKYWSAYWLWQSTDDNWNDYWYWLKRWHPKDQLTCFARFIIDIKKKKIVHGMKYVDIIILEWIL